VRQAAAEDRRENRGICAQRLDERVESRRESLLDHIHMAPCRPNRSESAGIPSMLVVSDVARKYFRRL
jgi:hypothetical protein